MAQLLCQPESSLAYKFLVSAPGGRSVKFLRSQGFSGDQIKTAWKTAVRGSSLSETDICRPEPAANTICTIKLDSTVEDVSVKITAADHLKFKIPSDWIFPNASPGSHIHGQVRWDSFHFLPNELTSQFVDSEDFLKMEVSKTKVKSDGMITNDKWSLPVEDGGANIGEFSIRANIRLTKNVNKVILVISALPWSTSEFDDHPGNCQAPSYPTIHIKSLDVGHNGRNNEEMGLPMFPLLFYLDEDTPTLESEDERTLISDNLVRAVRAFWLSAKVPVNVPYGDWLASRMYGRSTKTTSTVSFNTYISTSEDDRNNTQEGVNSTTHGR